MDANMVAELRAVSNYIRETKIQLGELEAIKRLLGCAETLDAMADRMEAALAEEKQNEDNNQQRI